MATAGVPTSELSIPLGCSPAEHARLLAVVCRAAGLDVGDTVAYTTIVGGITNQLLKVVDNSGVPVLVRLFGHNTDLLIDRGQDNRLFCFLGGIAAGPRCYLVFANGRVEQFFDARALDPVEMRKPPFLRGIADALAHFHGLHPPGIAAEPVLWRRLRSFLELASGGGVSSAVAQAARPVPAQARQVRWEAIADEIAWLQSELPSERNRHGLGLWGKGAEACESDAAKPAATVVDSGLDISTLAGAAAFICRTSFCHNDLLSGNFLVDQSFLSSTVAASATRVDSIPALHLIDYEYADTNYVAYDLANHICEHTGFESAFERDFPDARTRREVVAAYCRAAGARFPASAPAAGPTVDELVAHMSLWVDRFVLASHFWWGLWAMVQARYAGAMDFDYAAYTLLRLRGYELHKAMFFPGAPAARLVDLV